MLTEGELLVEIYNEYIGQGMNEDDAYTEAYSVICNMDED